MIEVKVRALFDFSNTSGNTYPLPLDNGQIVIQQADGTLISRRPDGSQRVTPLYTREEFVMAVAQAVAATIQQVVAAAVADAVATQTADLRAQIAALKASLNQQF